jgi:hypothetical protein
MPYNAPIHEFDVVPFTYMYTFTTANVLDIGLHICPNGIPQQMGDLDVPSLGGPAR